MRIKGEILSVHTTGDQLIVKMQGHEEAAAHWRENSIVTFSCTDNAVYRKALHVGRRMCIDIVAV